MEERFWVETELKNPMNVWVCTERFVCHYWLSSWMELFRHRFIGNLCLCQGGNADIMTATYCAAQDARAAMRHIFSNIINMQNIDSALFIGRRKCRWNYRLHATFWGISPGQTVLIRMHCPAPVHWILPVIQSRPLLNQKLWLIPAGRFQKTVHCWTMEYSNHQLSRWIWLCCSTNTDKLSVVFVSLSTGQQDHPLFILNSLPIIFVLNIIRFLLSVIIVVFKPELISKSQLFLKSLFCQSCQSDSSIKPALLFLAVCGMQLKI